MIYYCRKIRDLAYAYYLYRCHLKRSLVWSAQVLKDHQNRRLKKLIAYAKKKSPFYAQHLKNVIPGKTPLEEIPILTKETLLEHFDDLVTRRHLTLKDLTHHLDHLETDAYYQKFFKAFRSGGSSGNPAVMIYHWREWSKVLAQVLRSSCGVVKKPRGRRIRGANIYARTPTHDSLRIGQSFEVGFHEIKDLAVDMPTDRLVKILNDYQPDVLSGYPSAITELAYAQDDGRLKINPQAIFLGSEPLTQAMRQEIINAFGITPHDHYGTTEAIIMATECHHHQGLHLNQDVNIVEIVDENNQPVAPGQTGYKVLVTNLYALTQPIIRYEVSDILIAKAQPAGSACTCGATLPLIRQVVGRNEDLLHFRNTRGQAVTVPHQSLRQAMNQVENVRQFQIIRDRDEIFVKTMVHYPNEQNQTVDLVIKHLSAVLQNVDVKIKRISCEIVDHLERNQRASQKFRQIWNRQD